MFKASKGFIVGVFSVPFGWRMWVVLLVLVNAIIPLLFFSRPEAQMTFVLFAGSFAIGLVIFNAQGFTRLLGLMHLPWLLLIFFLLESVAQTSSRSFFGLWIRVVIILDTISLMLDAFDVFRYVCGERESTVGL